MFKIIGLFSTLDNTRENAESNQLRSGYLQPIDNGIVQILQILAQDRAYAGMPFVRIQPIIKVVREQNYLAAVKNGLCCGVILYIRISSDTAKRCIIEKRQCRANEEDLNGSDIFITAIAGSATKWLMRDFIARFTGRLILFERHVFIGDQLKSKGLGWIDRKGSLKGVVLG